VREDGAFAKSRKYPLRGKSPGYRLRRCRTDGRRVTGRDLPGEAGNVKTLVSVTKAAQMLSTTPLHVMELCRTGELTCGDIEGVMVIPVAAVHDYEKRRTVTGDARAG
jgi:hypothetical protein